MEKRTYEATRCTTFIALQGVSETHLKPPSMHGVQTYHSQRYRNLISYVWLSFRGRWRGVSAQPHSVYRIELCSSLSFTHQCSIFLALHENTITRFYGEFRPLNNGDAVRLIGHIKVRSLKRENTDTFRGG